MYVILARNLVGDCLGIFGPFNSYKQATTWIQKYTEYKVNVISVYKLVNPDEAVKEWRLDEPTKA